MIVFPNSKINLGLHVIRKRPAGYHDLETVFYPLPLTDALEIVPLGSHEYTSSFPFTLSGAVVKGRITSNLCVRAYKLLKKDFPTLPKVKIHLHKSIPSGAGLGGGSADAAFALSLLNRMFGLAIPINKLLNYAEELGSDCPFFIINKPCFATGKGEILEELPLDLSSFYIIIVNPGIHIDTGIAFLSIKPAVPRQSIREVICRPPAEWKHELINDFENSVFIRFPEIEKIKKQLYASGAVYASMSGSGSTVFGIFPKATKPDLNFPATYFVRSLPGYLG